MGAVCQQRTTDRGVSAGRWTTLRLLCEHSGAARGKTSNWDAADEHEVLVGVDCVSIFRVPLEVVVRAGRVAGRTDITNDVARLDLTERAEQGQVRVVHVAIFAVDVDPEPA